MGSLKQEFKLIEIVVVPASDLDPNPENPYDRIGPEERRRRFVEILARLHADAAKEKPPLAA